MSAHEPQSGIVLGNSSGSIVRNSYVERQMTVYAIYDYEATSLSNLSTNATLAFSLGSLVMSLPVSIWANWLFTDKPTELAQFATKFIAPGCITITAAFYIFGVVSLIQRAGLWTRIKAQSQAR